LNTNAAKAEKIFKMRYG